MLNTERAAEIMFELRDLMRNAARDGNAHERIDEMVAAQRASGTRGHRDHRPLVDAAGSKCS